MNNKKRGSFVLDGKLLAHQSWTTQRRHSMEDLPPHKQGGLFFFYQFDYTAGLWRERFGRSHYLRKTLVHGALQQCFFYTVGRDLKMGPGSM